MADGASELTAVRTDPFYRDGPVYSGPLHNLFMIERYAQGYFPETFGDMTDNEQLFDRQRVADIVNGDI